MELAGEMGAVDWGEGERPAGGWEVVGEEEAEFDGLAAGGAEGALADVRAVVMETSEGFPDVVAGLLGCGGGAEEERVPEVRAVWCAGGDAEC